MIFDDMTITAYDSDVCRIERLNRLRGAFCARIQCHDCELVERTGLVGLHDHKGNLESVWMTDIDEKMWAHILAELWLQHFDNGTHVSSAASADNEHKRAKHYLNFLKGAVK